MRDDVFSKHFREQYGFADTGRSVISSARLSSTFNCVNQCLNKHGCVAVVYHSTSKICSLLNSSDTLTSTTDQGYSYTYVGVHCSPGWVEFEGSCYLFGNEALSWSGSMEFCNAKGAILVEIETAAETAFIQGTLTNQKNWIGLTDIDKEGEWVWSSTGLEATYKDFYPGQPNNGLASNCGSIWKEYNIQWVDEPCHYKFFPICEQSSTSRPDAVPFR